MSDNEGGDVKRGRGRPKKSEPRGESKDTSDEPKAKRGRGRPKGGPKKTRKVRSGGSSSPSKRGRGRPKKNESKDKSSSDQGGSGDEKDD